MYNGGFLAGYKTYLVAAAMILDALIRWAGAGEITLPQFIDVLFSQEVLTALGLAALRHGVAQSAGAR